MNPRGSADESDHGRAATPRILQFGSFELRADTGELRKHGIRVRLQTKPLHVLLALLQHPGEVVTREQLQSRLWPADTFVDFESGLNTAANRLRIALGDSADVPRYIETLPRIGYRFIAPVREVPVAAAVIETAPVERPAPEPLQRAAEPAVPASAPPAAPPAQAQPERAQRGHIALVWVTSAAALIFAAMLLSDRFVTTVHGRQNPQFHEITFSHGSITTARFAPDGQSVVYTNCEKGTSQIYLGNTLSPESRSLGFPNASLVAVSRDGELALFRKPPDTITDGPMLVRAPMNGGAPRETARSILGADWGPDGDSLAAIRESSGQFAIEYPLGKVLFRTAGWADSMRVSPDGEHLAFIEHPIATDDAGQVIILDRSGHVIVESQLWATAEGLAWTPSAREVWFTAGDLGTQRALHAISLSGARRLIANAPGTLRLRDISPTGRVLISRDNVRMLMTGKPAGAAAPEDLSWYDFSHVEAISPDGNLILFTEGGEAGGVDYSIYVHNQRTGATTRVGRGQGLAISPDQSRILAMDIARADCLRLIPMNAGETRVLSGGGLRYQWATFFPDGRRLLVGGSMPGQPMRLYTQTLDGGRPAPLNTSVYLYEAVISPDGKQVAGKSGESAAILSLDTMQVRTVPKTADLMPLAWSTDGARVLAAAPSGNAWNLIWVDPAGDRSQPVSTLAPPELGGMVNLAGIAATPSGQAWVSSWHHLISQLYVVDGWS